MRDAYFIKIENWTDCFWFKKSLKKIKLDERKPKWLRVLTIFSTGIILLLIHFYKSNFEIKTTTLVILNSCVGFFTVSKKSSLGCSIGIWMKCFKSFYSGRLGNKRYSRSITSYQRVPILYELYEPILYDSYNMSHIRVFSNA